jgi:UMF1 family MFS transporter
VIDAGSDGEHVLWISAAGGPIAIEEIEVLPPARKSDLLAIFGLLIGVQVLAGAFAVTAGRRLLAGVASRMTTKRTIGLALLTYALISLWGFRLNAVIEFWLLAFLIAVVQGGSQALSRSLYAAMSPAALSGEFFGFFSVMAKFSAIVGPLLFVASIDWFGGSRPALLGLTAFFVIGLVLLSRVDVEDGKRVAAEADRAAFGKEPHVE